MHLFICLIILIVIRNIVIRKIQTRAIFANICETNYLCGVLRTIFFFKKIVLQEHFSYLII